MQTTMAVQDHISRAYRIVGVSGKGNRWRKRWANRKFRRSFNEQVRLGAEAWSEINMTTRKYLHFWDIV